MNQIERLFSPLIISYFSLGRHALLEGLKLKGIVKGCSILVPNFICKDLLQPINELGLEIKWLNIGNDCVPADPCEFWPIADAVLMVNYFGFPQDLEQYKKYSNTTGALLIEDCAHGFLSRDQHGRALGTRGDIAIASLRKVMPLCDGAILIAEQKVSQVENLSGQPFNPRIKLRVKMKNYNKFLFQLGINSFRLLKKLSSNDAIAEDKIPHHKEPYREIYSDLERFNLSENLLSRRITYSNFINLSKALHIEPIYKELPHLVSPYGFAFRSSSFISLIIIWLYAMSKGYDFFTWPDLPTEVKENNKEIEPVYFVNFL